MFGAWTGRVGVVWAAGGQHRRLSGTEGRNADEAPPSHHRRRPGARSPSRSCCPQPTPTPSLGGPTPAPGPTPSATPGPTPTPTPGSGAPPTSGSCKLPPSSNPNAPCSMQTPAFLGAVDKAITQLTEQQPSIFNFNNKLCENCYYVKDEAAYVAGVIKNLNGAGMLRVLRRRGARGEELELVQRAVRHPDLLGPHPPRRRLLPEHLQPLRGFDPPAGVRSAPRWLIPGNPWPESQS